MSIDANTVIKCNKCFYEQIYFTEARGPGGNKIPYETRTGQRHDCMFSQARYCEHGCGSKLYIDFSRPELGYLNYLTSDPHQCPRRDNNQ